VQEHEAEIGGDDISYAFIISVRWSELESHNFTEIENINLYLQHLRKIIQATLNGT